MQRGTTALPCLLLLIGCGDSSTGERTKEGVTGGIGRADAKSADEAKLHKLRVGMTLQEVEAILGEGTRYCDLAMKVTFTIDDPEAQRNTYVWPRGGGVRFFIVGFEQGRLAHSVLCYPAKK